MTLSSISSVPLYGSSAATTLLTAEVIKINKRERENGMTYMQSCGAGLFLRGQYASSTKAIQHKHGHKAAHRCSAHQEKQTDKRASAGYGQTCDVKHVYVCVLHMYCLTYNTLFEVLKKKKKDPGNFKTVRAYNYQRGQRTCVCAYVYLCLQDYE